MSLRAWAIKTLNKHASIHLDKDAKAEPKAGKLFITDGKGGRVTDGASGVITGQ
ncbi:MAG: hypothetical protein PVI90_09875 [Desulfobacteraceae bacterium]|jgi:hypothetical protein